MSIKMTLDQNNEASNEHTTPIEKEIKVLESEIAFLREYLLMNQPAKSTLEAKNDCKKTTVSEFLCTQQKLQMATSILGNINAEKSKIQHASENLIDSLTIMTEETELRITDLQKDAFDFKKSVVIGAENPINGCIEAEKVVRYYQSKAVALDALVEKLRLKQTNLKSKHQKLDAQLKQREEANSFHYIDFHQVQIENKRFSNEIEDKRETLQKVKLSVEKANRKIQFLQQEVKKRESTNNSLDKSVTLRVRQLERIQNDVNNINAKFHDKSNAERDCRQIKDGEAPHEVQIDIMDLIQQKSKIFELRSSIKTWERKVEIAEINSG